MRHPAITRDITRHCSLCQKLQKNEQVNHVAKINPLFGAGQGESSKRV